MNEVLYHQSFVYISEIERIELISRHNNNLLVKHYQIEKTHNLVVQK